MRAPGWALVGDAAYHRDPLTGMGIGDAFLGAELLADAIDAASAAISSAASKGYQENVAREDRRRVRLHADVGGPEGSDATGAAL